MAGERYAKLTLRAGWSWNDSFRGAQTENVEFRLGVAWVKFERGGNATQFTVPDPDDGAGRAFVKQGLTNLRALLVAAIAQRGLSYSVSAVRDVGDDPTHGGWQDGASQAWPPAEFDVEAGLYDPTLTLAFRTISAYGG